MTTNFKKARRQRRQPGLSPALAIFGACFAWGIDNNLMRKVSLADAIWVASMKGLVAGSVNLGLALRWGHPCLGGRILPSAMVVGFVAYGASLALFVVALRHLATRSHRRLFFSSSNPRRTPRSTLHGDRVTNRLLFTAGLMALGIWLHLTERHEHEHTHEALEHEHEQVHDEHHQHEHEETITVGQS